MKCLILIPRLRISLYFVLTDGAEKLSSAYIIRSSGFSTYAGNDTIYGGNDADHLHGGDGNDIVYGGDGHDYMRGQDGDDILFGQEGSDRLYGGNHNDSLDGGSGNDYLYGHNGDDVLYGGFGRDYLNGGAGADRFVIKGETAFDNYDRIVGFNSNEGDTIILDGLLEGYNSATDLISDFITKTENATHTYIKVDRDGAGTTYGIHTVARIEKVTSEWSDINDMIAKGDVVVI